MPLNKFIQQSQVEVLIDKTTRLEEDARRLLNKVCKNNFSYEHSTDDMYQA